MFGECHGHIFMDGINYKEARAMHAQAVNQADVRKKLAEYKDVGVTFFRDGGDALSVSEYAAAVAPEYGIDYRTPIYAIHKNGHYGSIVGRGFDTFAEYHRLVLGVRERGGDFIKVMFSGIMDFADGGSVTGTPLTREEIREMIHIAHEEGFAVMAHVNGARTIQDAVEAGVDSVEHGNFMDRECLQAFAESEAVWVPTLVTIGNLVESDRFDSAVMRELDRRQAANIAAAFEMGITVALGSDAGAYRVPHAIGIQDEYHRFCQIIPNRELLDQELSTAEDRIREKFRRV